MGVMRRVIVAGVVAAFLYMGAGPGSAVSGGVDSLLAAIHPEIAANTAPTTGGLYLWRTPELSPLDANTLADVPNGETINVGDAALTPPWAMSSADGSKILAVAAANPDTGNPPASDITMRVLDVRTGIELSRFHPAVAVFPDGVTNDGRQVFGWVPKEVGKARMTWYLLDAATGQVLNQIPLKEWCCVPTQYDAAIHRLFVFNESQVGPGVVFGPRRLTIVAYAVDTETQLGKLKLNDFPAGDWLSGRKVKGDPVVQVNRAGIAISPDGKRIALLNPSRDVLTTVDAENLRVLRETRVTQAQSFLDAVADRLGLTVQTAEAKAQQGYSAWLMYSPDGSRLYERGYVQTESRNGKFSNRSTGLQVIDATTGRIMAERTDLPVDALSVAPDGSAVYTVGQPVTGGVGTISRLEPATLATTAQRTLQPADVGLPIPLAAPARSLACGAASPSQGIAMQGSAPDGSLWALGLGGLTAHQSTKIVWRMTGSGDLRMYAEAADGTRITPDWGPELHTGGSSWSGYNPPGDDYGSGWTFPKAGCWRIHAARDNVAGDIWFNVGS